MLPAAPLDMCLPRSRLGRRMSHTRQMDGPGCGGFIWDGRGGSRVLLAAAVELCFECVCFKTRYYFIHRVTSFRNNACLEKFNCLLWLFAKAAAIAAPHATVAGSCIFELMFDMHDREPVASAAIWRHGLAFFGARDATTVCFCCGSWDCCWGGWVVRAAAASARSERRQLRQ